jgi:hypothetical protein
MPSGEWTDGAFPIRRARIVAARLDTYRPSLADKRVALIVGNSSYQNAAKLPNPAKDADAIAEMFKKAGYEVSLLKDVGNLEFKRSIRRFEDSASDADTAVIFYAGHGIEIGGANYVIPVDANAHGGLSPARWQAPAAEAPSLPPESGSTIYADIDLAVRGVALNIRRSRGIGSANRNPCPNLMPRERTRLR